MCRHIDCLLPTTQNFLSISFAVFSRFVLLVGFRSVSLSAFFFVSFEIFLVRKLNHNWPLLTCFFFLGRFGFVWFSAHGEGRKKQCTKFRIWYFTELTERWWARVLNAMMKHTQNTWNRRRRRRLREKDVVFFVVCLVSNRPDCIDCHKPTQYTSRQGKQQNKSVKHTRNGLFGCSVNSVPPNFGRIDVVSRDRLFWYLLISDLNRNVESVVVVLPFRLSNENLCVRFAVSRLFTYTHARYLIQNVTQRLWKTGKQNFNRRILFYLNAHTNPFGFFSL